jgi:hypothetical protein
MLGIKGANGIGPLINQQQTQIKQDLKKNIAIQQQAEQQGNKIIRKVLTTRIKGVGSNLNIQV